MGKPTTDLSPMENRVLTLIAEGLSDKEISGTLKLAYNTVQSYVKRLREKLKARGFKIHSRVHLARVVWSGELNLETDMEKALTAWEEKSEPGTDWASFWAGWRAK